MTERRTFLAVAATTPTQVRPGVAQDVTPMVEHPAPRANYIPDAPMRDRVGTGKIIRGRVVSTGAGQPIGHGQVEYHLNTTPDAGGIGEQNPANRGQVTADSQGRFAFECNPPQPVWVNAAPHVHTRATADGHAPFFYRDLTPSDPSQDDVTIVLVGV